MDIFKETTPNSTRMENCAFKPLEAGVQGIKTVLIACNSVGQYASDLHPYKKVHGSQYLTIQVSYLALK